MATIDLLGFGPQKTAPFKPPNKSVSPFIRGSRFVALTAGIIYGSYRFASLQKKELEIQKQENEIRARRDVRLAAEKEANMKVEMNSLAKEVGVPNRM
ncbi:uncharacterized protein [Watersipora subatra]|uniref:uncharacterized protein n=1 Tax=Watersipora subatra TaxID=2589382 RepID=UPI00355B26DA